MGGSALRPVRCGGGAARGALVKIGHQLGGRMALARSLWLGALEVGHNFFHSAPVTAEGHVEASVNLRLREVEDELVSDTHTHTGWSAQGSSRPRARTSEEVAIDFEQRAHENVAHGVQAAGGGGEEGPWPKRFSAKGMAARMDMAPEARRSLGVEPGDGVAGLLPNKTDGLHCLARSCSHSGRITSSTNKARRSR